MTDAARLALPEWSQRWVQGSSKGVGRVRFRLSVAAEDELEARSKRRAELEMRRQARTRLSLGE